MKDHVINRRSLLKGALATSSLGLAGLDSETLRAFAAEPPAKRPKIKFGVCDWTIDKRADPAAFALAKNLGYEGVQVDMGIGEETLPLQNKALREQIKQASQATGVEIGSLATGVLNEIPFKSEAKADKWVEDSLEVAADLGVKVILLAFFSKNDLLEDSEGMTRSVEKLKRIAPRAEKAGMTFAIESWLSARDTAAMLDRIGSSHVKMYYDVGNSTHKGYDIIEEIHFLGKERIAEMHAKDYDGIYGKGSIDFAKVFRALGEIGYEGYMHIEGFQYPLGLEESLKYDVKFLRETLAAI